MLNWVIQRMCLSRCRLSMLVRFSGRHTRNMSVSTISHFIEEGVRQISNRMLFQAGVNTQDIVLSCSCPQIVDRSSVLYSSPFSDIFLSTWLIHSWCIRGNSVWKVDCNANQLHGHRHDSARSDAHGMRKATAWALYVFPRGQIFSQLKDNSLSFDIGYLAFFPRVWKCASFILNHGSKHTFSF